MAPTGTAGKSRRVADCVGRKKCGRVGARFSAPPIRFFPIPGSFIRVLEDQVDSRYIPTVCILLHVIFISFFTGKVSTAHPGSKISQDL